VGAIVEISWKGDPTTAFYHKPVPAVDRRNG